LVGQTRNPSGSDRWLLYVMFGGTRPCKELGHPSRYAEIRRATGSALLTWNHRPSFRLVGSEKGLQRLDRCLLIRFLGGLIRRESEPSEVGEAEIHRREAFSGADEVILSASLT
jgi:hypothetical protein